MALSMSVYDLQYFSRFFYYPCFSNPLPLSLFLSLSKKLRTSYAFDISSSFCSFTVDNVYAKKENILFYLYVLHLFWGMTFIFKKEVQYVFGKLTCDPSLYTMDHHDMIVSSLMEIPLI